MEKFDEKIVKKRLRKTLTNLQIHRKLAENFKKNLNSSVQLFSITVYLKNLKSSCGKRRFRLQKFRTQPTNSKLLNIFIKIPKSIYRIPAFLTKKYPLNIVQIS